MTCIGSSFLQTMAVNQGSVTLQLTADDSYSSSKLDYKRMTLRDKIVYSYQEKYVDPIVNRWANYAAISYFLFILHTELYVTVQHVIPYLFQDCDGMTRYYLKVLAWFIYLETAANWLCLKYFHSCLKLNDADSPTYEQMNSWERYVAGSQSTKIDSNGILSWRFCPRCDLQVPPRSHHCIICDRCILKRDHHCYITGVCVGYFNQRYFIILNFYIAAGSLLGLRFIYVYAQTTFIPQTSWLDLFLPWSVWNWVLGQGLDTHQVFILFHLYTLWWTGLTALCFFSWQIILVVLGKTNQEVKAGLRVRYTGGVSESFRSVFGLMWPINFILPAVIVFRQEGDGKHWPNVKPLL